MVRLLSDVMMPGMLGHELVIHLHDTRPGTSVVFTSGYAGGLMNSSALFLEDLPS